MKLSKLSVLSLVAAFAILPATAFAEAPAQPTVIKGTVASIADDGQSFEITRMNEETGVEETVRVWVNDATTYAEDIEDIDGLIEGDPLELEVEQDRATGNWVVTSVKFSEEELAEAEEVPAEEETAEEAS